MKPIYKPKGAAAEYGDYALNIYTGCPHGCFYCYVPQVIHREREVFHGHVEPRKGLLNDLRRQLEREQITGKLIHLCFTCDPYPVGRDTTVTREVIQALKEYGNHVQILTKGDGRRDFDILDENDWYGITITCGPESCIKNEPYARNAFNRLVDLDCAKRRGVKTWVSFEPVLDAEMIITVIQQHYDLFDKVKIGKLNYHPSDINWAKFGRDVVEACRRMGLDYYIKDSLRAEMDKP